MHIRPGVVRAATWGLAGGTAAAVLTILAIPLGLSSTNAIVPVAVSVAAIVATGKFVRDRVATFILASEHRLKLRLDRLDRLEPRLTEVAAIAAFSSMEMSYPIPLGGDWALSWDAALILAREVGVERPRTVVELGSGASSLVIGMQLRRAGQGHLYTLDHDVGYAAVTRRHVASLGLDPWVTVLDAPLVSQQVDGAAYRWYELPATVRGLERIDFLVVDGPPQATDPDGMPRYPALPMLRFGLGPGSVIFVDDANRAAERRMVERWLSDDRQWVSETIATRRGTAILRWPRPI